MDVSLGQANSFQHDRDTFMKTLHSSVSIHIHKV